MKKLKDVNKKKDLGLFYGCMVTITNWSNYSDFDIVAELIKKELFERNMTKTKIGRWLVKTICKYL